VQTLLLSMELRPTQDVPAWKMGTAESAISRLQALTEHFGVRDDEINLSRGQGRPGTSNATVGEGDQLRRDLGAVVSQPSREVRTRFVRPLTEQLGAERFTQE
jgi:hypothetical protein